MCIIYQADRKDLSAVQLLGKRDNAMTSHEELNGTISKNAVYGITKLFKLI